MATTPSLKAMTRSTLASRSSAISTFPHPSLAYSIDAKSILERDHDHLAHAPNHGLRPFPSVAAGAAWRRVAEGEPRENKTMIIFSPFGIILSAADGQSNAAIAAEVDVHLDTVREWRRNSSWPVATPRRPRLILARLETARQTGLLDILAGADFANRFRRIR